MIFSYKGLYKGSLVEGLLEAENKASALSKLKAQGIKVLSLKEVSSKASRIDTKFLERFTSNLFQLLKSGLTVDKAILFIAEREKKHHEKLLKVYEEIRSGSTLSMALRLSNLFPDFYVQMIRSAEESGSLEETLSLILDFIKEENELKSSILTAMIYPSFVFGVSVFSLLVISSYVVPKFKLVFQSTDIKLPLLTRLMFSLTDAINYIIIGALISLLILFAYLRYAIKIRKHRLRLESILYKIPFLGKLLLDTEIIRTFQTLYTLVKGGVALNHALELATDVPTTLRMRDAIKAIHSDVVKGASLSKAMKLRSVFPEMVIEIVSVGEQTGELTGAFYQIYTTYNEEFKASVKRFISLLEPAIILIMGLVVGLIVFSMILAVFSLSEGL
ncbi:type II secretion system F family protein [Hydrogenobacter hydrogenophilus]|uniref:Type II secretion system protein F (GspF) n=1 Tax=Hydrogenobacter hydrogenophilus TaxID=35835 RepID=A0A285P3W0_9AQUI|nr:type II secretion system F family protein [Hydrogenobacter hydrogenophilus]SNZ16410.1 type II secretion system protein F (GspF) [Hydrogenobacter hydrogenophilus]